jgi:hypothetical protein
VCSLHHQAPHQGEVLCLPLHKCLQCPLQDLLPPLFLSSHWPPRCPTHNHYRISTATVAHPDVLPHPQAHRSWSLPLVSLWHDFYAVATSQEPSVTTHTHFTEAKLPCFCMRSSSSNTSPTSLWACYLSHLPPIPNLMSLTPQSSMISFSMASSSLIVSKCCSKHSEHSLISSSPGLHLYTWLSCRIRLQLVFSLFSLSSLTSIIHYLGAKLFFLQLIHKLSLRKGSDPVWPPLNVN